MRKFDILFISVLFDITQHKIIAGEVNILEGIGRKLSMNTIAACLEVVREITNILIHDILSVQRDLIPAPPEHEPTTGFA
jgi:hypothetical protein